MPNSKQISVTRGTRPVLTFVMVDSRNEVDAGALVDITGFVLKLIVKRDREDADAIAWVDLEGEILDGPLGQYRFTLTPAQTSIPPGNWPGEIRLWAPPDAPETECSDALAAAGAGNVDNGVHYYKITFVDPYGESDGSPASDGVTVADKTVNGKVALTAIPLGPSGTTARKIYRTVAGDDPDSGTYKLVATISDNSTATYQDNTADAGLGAELAAAADTDARPLDSIPVDYEVVETNLR